MSSQSSRTVGAMPSISRHPRMFMIIAGSVATVAFDVWGQAISPMLGFGNLSPDGLARSLLGKFGLPNGAPQGNFMHLVLIGLIAYPVGWLFIFRPIQERVLPNLGWFVASTIYGFGLWILAIGIIAWIALGQPFLGFTTITWVALVGHVLYGIVSGWITDYLE